MSSFLGHFHPALVHLPIGIILLAFLFEWLSHRSSFEYLAPAVRPAYGLGAISAILACLTGHLLAEEGGYDSYTLERHRWVGIATASLATLRFALDRSVAFQQLKHRLRTIPSLALLLLISVGGHLGGTLTHGSGYLLAGAPDWLRSGLGEENVRQTAIQVADVQEARVYDDLVARILQEKCTGCHGVEKQKGGLRLDQAALILQGGEHGKVLGSGEPSGSEMYRRAMLPLEDEDHMPPKGKPQLTAAETALLEWWIRNGHDFEKKVRDIPQTPSDRTLLVSFRTGSSPEAAGTTSILPAEEVEAAQASVVQALRSLGVVVMPLDPSRNYLRVNFRNLTRPADSVAGLLSDIREQVLMLELAGSDLTDAGCVPLSELRNLRKLNLTDTRITDAGLSNLARLTELDALNLNGTDITGAGLRPLASLKKLRNLYLFRTKVNAAEVSALAGTIPSARIDTGNYRLPLLEGDTSEVTAPPKGEMIPRSSQGIAVFCEKSYLVSGPDEILTGIGGSIIDVTVDMIRQETHGLHVDHEFPGIVQHPTLRIRQ